MSKKVPLAAVIGHPVAHSKSPILHGYWLKKYGISGHYIPIDIEPGVLFEGFDALIQLGFKGANITVPHKENVMSRADEITARARKIGAANTITFGDDGTVHADNTDGMGFLENLRQSCPSWRADAGPAALLGAGGAARSVISELLDAGTPEIRLTNRNPERAQAIADIFGSKVITVPWSDAPDIFDGVATAVNGTSLGMVGQPPFDISLGALPTNAVATDLVYTPLDTAFLQNARTRGCRTVDGLGMLLHQAAPGFERWFGVKPAVTDGLRDAVLTG